MLALSFLVIIDMIYNIDHRYISIANTRCKNFLNTSDTQYVSTGCLDNVQPLKPPGVAPQQGGLTKALQTCKFSVSEQRTGKHAALVVLL